MKKWMAKAARFIAQRYARNFGLEREDVEQEAWAIMLKAERSENYDPGRASEQTYIEGAARRGLLGYCVRAKAPVSSLSSLGLAELMRMRRMDAEGNDPIGPSSEEVLQEAAWPAEVRTIVYSIVGTDAEVRAALRVLVGELTANEAANAVGMKAREFYPVVARVREDLASNRQLWTAWKERP